MATLKEFLFSIDKCNPESEKYGAVEGLQFIIPFLQRTYRWSPTQAIQLLEDLQEFTNPENTKMRYCMQPLAVCKNGESWELLDGQQRLTTFLMIHRVLFGWTGIESAPYIQLIARPDAFTTLPPSILTGPSILLHAYPIFLHISFPSVIVALSFALRSR